MLRSAKEEKNLRKKAEVIHNAFQVVYAMAVII